MRESLRGVRGWQISVTGLASISAIRIVLMIDSAVIKCFREVEHIVRRENYAAHASSHICSHVFRFKYKDKYLRGMRDKEQGNQQS